MTFGLDVFNADGDLRWAAEDHALPLVDVWNIFYDFSPGGPAYVERSYPELTGATIRCEVVPASWSAAITYPSGVPTITVTPSGYAIFSTLIYVFLESLPEDLETQFSYRILNADGSYALSPINNALEYVETVSSSSVASTGDYCINYDYLNGPTATYKATVAQADYPDAPFVMIDLPTHPYFGGVMNVAEEGSNWAILIGGSFASAPSAYVFRKTTPVTAPTSGFGIALYNPDAECIFTTSSNLLGFVGEPEVPAIYEFDVPADDGGSVTIGNLDQSWTPTVALPTNALLWVASRQIVCTEDCEEPPKVGYWPRIVREWTSGVCRYDTDDLMLRLHTKTSYTRNAAGSETFYGDVTNGEAYKGMVFIADKDRML